MHSVKEGSLILEQCVLLSIDELVNPIPHPVVEEHLLTGQEISGGCDQTRLRIPFDVTPIRRPVVDLLGPPSLDIDMRSSTVYTNANKSPAFSSSQASSPDNYSFQGAKYLPCPDKRGCDKHALLSERIPLPNHDSAASLCI